MFSRPRRTLHQFVLQWPLSLTVWSSLLQKRSSKIRLTAAFVGLMLMLISVNACVSPAASTVQTTRTPEQVADVLQRAVQGGNLHYQNFVLTIGEQILFNSSSGQLGLGTLDGSTFSALIKDTGAYPAYDGSRLYYLESDLANALAKISLDGANQVRIGQTPLKYLICDGNWLYAIESESGVVIRLKKDGSAREVLLDQPAVSLALANGKLYVSGAAKPYGLTMVDLATLEQETLFDEPIASLNISGDWLYFSQPSDGYKLHAWSTGRKTGSVISRLSLDKPFIVSDGYLYYADLSQLNRLYRLPVDGQQNLDGIEPELVVDDLVASFVICSEYVYYQRPSSNRIYQVALDGLQVRRIT